MASDPPPTLFVSTGDASGDWHGAEVVRALRRRLPGLVVHATGGSHLQEAGADLLFDQRNMGHMGWGLISAIPTHVHLGLKAFRHIQKAKPRVVLFIDYGGYHLLLARLIRRRAPHCAPHYYIPPQVWASRPGRIRVIRQCFRQVFCIFPFEEPLYREAGVPVSHVGHPLLGQLPEPADRTEFCLRHGLDPRRPIIALLPGSRASEVERHLGPLVEGAGILLAHAGVASCQWGEACPEPQMVVSQASNLDDSFFEGRWQAAFGQLSPEAAKSVMRLRGESHALLSVSRFAIGASGTVTLESALYGTPMVVIYKASWGTFQIVKRVVRVPHLALPNLLHHGLAPSPEPRLFPELHQYNVTPEKIAAAALPWLDPSSPSHQGVVKTLGELRTRLGRTRAAEAVADALLPLLLATP